MRHQSLSAAEFAAAVGTEPKWVYNAAAVLRRPIPYGVAEARHLGLVREINASFKIPLKTADALAGAALAQGGGQAVTVAAGTSEDGSAQVVVDVARYLSIFTARLSRALAGTAEKRRGPRRRRSGSVIAAARAHGVDLGLLLSSLALTPTERLRRLDENAAFLAAMRPVASGGRPRRKRGRGSARRERA